MRLFDPDPSLCWLFCMTHPDDEISICAWIRRLVRQGNPVFISWTHSTPVREREGRRSAERLGIPSERCHFFHAPDGHVVDQLPQLLSDVQPWIEEVRPDRIACGAFEQGHIDHDATNWLVNHAFQGPVLEIPFYHTYLGRYQRMNRFADATGEEILDLDEEEQRFKKDFAKGFPSQRIWWNLWWYEAAEFVRGRPIELAKTERMRLQTHRDWRRPNVPPHLRERVERSAPWQRWLAAMDSVGPHLSR